MTLHRIPTNPLNFSLISGITILFSCLLTLTQTHADAQINRDSYAAIQQSMQTSTQHSRQQSTFSFEQHALTYTNSSWIPDAEISIDGAMLKAFLPATLSSTLFATQKTNSTSEQGFQNDAFAMSYQTRLSDKSFGVVIRYSF